MKALFVFFLALTIITTNAFAFELASYEVKAKKGKPVEVKVTNKYDSEVTIKVDIEKETVKEVPEGAGDCSGSLKVFPKLFRLKQNETQFVKFISRKSGFCRVFFLVDKDRPDSVQVEGINLNVLFRVGIPVEIEEQ